MSAGGDEQDITGWFHPGHGTHQLKPASDATAALAGTGPPAATRSHDYQWRQGSIRALNTGCDIKGLGGRLFRVGDECHFRSMTCQVGEPASFFARNLKNRGTEGMQEAFGVARAKAWTPTARNDDDRSVAVLAAGFSERANSGSVGRDFSESDRSIARERA